MPTMIMPTYVHVIDLKRWFTECHIFMPKKAFDHGKTEFIKLYTLTGTAVSFTKPAGCASEKKRRYNYVKTN